MPDCENFLCFGHVSAVPADDGEAVVQKHVSVTKREAKEAGVKNELKKGGDGEVSDLSFRLARDD